MPTQKPILKKNKVPTATQYNSYANTPVIQYVAPDEYTPITVVERKAKVKFNPKLKLEITKKMWVMLAVGFALGNVTARLGLDGASSTGNLTQASLPVAALSMAKVEALPPEVKKNPGVDYHGKIFNGAHMSLVSVAVGSAEGTRTPNADYTKAYQGHTDPGNGVWNLGSFSYQHEASSPEDADVRQLARLQTQYEQILWWAQEYKLPEFTLEEALNAIDLANQSPKAAINDGGYALRMKEATDKGYTGYKKILYARSASYINPNNGKLDAPGLGNSWARVEQDQARRMDMIRATMDTYATF